MYVACKAGTYDQVRDGDLKDLGTQAGAVLEQSLQNVNHEMAERSADEGAVDGHLEHAAGEVVAMFVSVLCDPGGEKFLQGSKRTRGEHAYMQRILLQFLDIPLRAEHR